MKFISKISSIFLLTFTFANAAVADNDAEKRQLVLDYFEYIGVMTSINLTVETMFKEYETAYPHLPKEFWVDENVTAVFDDYKVAILQGYVETMEREVTYEELKFLVGFYSTDDGRKIVELGNRLDPLFIASYSEAGKWFSAAFAELIENYAR